MKYRETRHGPMIFPETDLYIGRSLDHYGEAHELQVKFLSSLIVPGDVVIDVGANLGIITVPLAKKVGPEGYVLALEAHNMLFYMLCGNLALNGLSHVQAFNRAATEKTGSLYYFPKLDFTKVANFGNMKLAGLLNSQDDHGKMYDNPVTGIAVDDLGISNPKLVKIDVEGMEESVLNGLKRTMRRAKPFLYVEFTQNREAIVDFLKYMDYEWALHEAPLFNPTNLQFKLDNILKHPETGTDLVSGDLICWHKSRKPELSDPFIVDLDTSEHPRHIEVREIRDNASKRSDFTVH